MWSGDCIGKTKVRNNISILPHLEQHSSQCRGGAKNINYILWFISCGVIIGQIPNLRSKLE